jgi:hypothetical protein
MNFLNISPSLWALFSFSALAGLRRSPSFGEENLMGYSVEYFDLEHGWTRVAVERSPEIAMSLIAYLRQDDASIAMRVVRVNK